MGLRNYSECVLLNMYVELTLTVFTATYSNLENHPRLIRARQLNTVPKIQLDPKTGLPIVDGERVSARSRLRVESLEEESEGEHSTFSFIVYSKRRHRLFTFPPATRITITRPKDESKEDKKSRKLAVKAERQARRVDKKANQERFSSEIKQQARRLSDNDKKKLRKL